MKNRLLIETAKMCKESIVERDKDGCIHRCSVDCPYNSGPGCIDDLVEDLAAALEKATLKISVINQEKEVQEDGKKE